MSGALPSPTTIPAGLIADPAGFDLGRFTDDVARKIWSPSVIAARYSLTPAEFVALVKVPVIASMIRLKHQQFHSDANAQERLATLWSVGMIDSASATIAALADPNTPLTQKIELLKIGMKVAGFDRGPTRDGPTGPMAAQFAVNIHFSNGKVETVNAAVIGPSQVIDHDAPEAEAA